MSISAKVVGKVGTDTITEYVLSCGRNVVRCINYGATIMSIRNNEEEITLNYGDFDELSAKGNTSYYGCAVGRVANRYGYMI